MRHALMALALVAALAACAGPKPAQTGAAAATPDRTALERQVADTERAFAKTMADRDHAGFTRFLSDEAVFFSGPTPLRGKAAVAAWWKRLYDKPEAPFSWKPDHVEALDSGMLALSTGPVMDAGGKCVGRFTSIWRQEQPGVWKIIFDKGGPCEQ